MAVLGQNDHFWTVVGPKWRKQVFFGKKGEIPLPYAYYAATLCKKPEQTYERILRSKANLQVPTASGGGPKTLILGYFGQKRPILDRFWPKKGQF